MCGRYLQREKVSERRTRESGRGSREVEKKRANAFVFVCGAIEMPRLALNLDRHTQRGISEAVHCTGLGRHVQCIILQEWVILQCCQCCVVPGAAGMAVWLWSRYLSFFLFFLCPFE